MKRFGFSTMPKCMNCGHWLWYHEMMYLNKDGQHICRKCSVKEDMLQWIHWTTEPQYLDLERENMETKNLEITVKLNGKEVPLSTISAGTFEMMKILEEKPKEIPVARLATYNSVKAEPRLLFRPTENIQFRVGKIYSLDLKRGMLATSWSSDDDEYAVEHTYPSGTKEL